MVLDLLFGWTMQYPLWVTILILSAGLSLIITIIYAKVTDQKELSRIKKKQKRLQDEMKEHRDDPKKTMQLQQKLMGLTGEYFKKSMKPLLYTSIPLIFVFAWMGANLAYAPLSVDTAVDVSLEVSEPAWVTLSGEAIEIIDPVEQESADNQIIWEIQAQQAGVHELLFETRQGDQANITLYVDEKPSATSFELAQPFVSASVAYPKATPFGSFSLFGYHPGWLFTYIVFSMVFSTLFRKLMKVA